MNAPHRLIKLRSPHTTGPDVTALQKKVGVDPDGEYGPVTARAVRARARALGVTEKTIAKGATIGIQRLILGLSRRTPAQLVRAKARAAKAKRTGASLPLRRRALALARRDVGVIFEVGGNNRGPMVEKVIKDNHGDVGEPWCGDQVADWYRRAGSKVVQRGWASTIWLLANLTRVRSPLAGHIVVFNFGSGGAKHTGLFDEWAETGWFWSIEGNTRPGANQSDSSGGRDGVYRVKRPVSYVAGWRRVNQ